MNACSFSLKNYKFPLKFSYIYGNTGTRPANELEMFARNILTISFVWGGLMATVSHLLATKSGCHVFSVSPETTVFDATRLMNAEHIGALLVVQTSPAGDELVGIFTERDVLRRVVAAGRQSDFTSVGAVMTRDIITCSIDTQLEEIAELMRGERIRHLPVLEGNQHIAGLISIGDLNAYKAGNCQLALQAAENYIQGRV